MRSGKPEPFHYLGCFKNEKQQRINSHLKDPKRFSECNAEAIGAGKATFGLEYPTGAKVAGESYCLLLTQPPPMDRVADRECEDEGLDKMGHRLGGPSRIAIYSTTHCGDFSAVNRACPVHGVGQLVPSQCDNVHDDLDNECKRTYSSWYEHCFATSREIQKLPASMKGQLTGFYAKCQSSGH